MIWAPVPKTSFTRAVIALFQASAATTPKAADAREIMVCKYTERFDTEDLLILLGNSLTSNSGWSPTVHPNFWRVARVARPASAEDGARHPTDQVQLGPLLS